MGVKAPQIQTIVVGETRNVAASFAGMLDDGELLTTPLTVVETVTTNLTIANKVVSSGALTINGVSVPTGEAVQFNVLGALANIIYVITITVTTDASPAQTFVRSVTLRGVAA